MKSQEMTLAQKIETCYIIMARIVRDHGDEYLPVFQRMHEERELFNANQDLKSKALQVAETLLK